MKKYLVTLTTNEREELNTLISAGKASGKKLAHARILLKADQADGGPAWTDEAIADAVEVSTDTVARVRQRFVEQDLEAALVRKKQEKPSRERILDGAAEAKLLAVACSGPPEGRAVWTPYTRGAPSDLGPWPEPHGAVLGSTSAPIKSAFAACGYPSSPANPTATPDGRTRQER